MISTYPVEMIKRLEDRIKELEIENYNLRSCLSESQWRQEYIEDQLYVTQSREEW